MSAEFDNAIAIVGMAGRFPGAADVDAFWEMLCAGREGIARLDEAALRAAGLGAAELANPRLVRAAGAVAEYDRFDAEFFGINPREAALLDPQHRVFLECAWEALERANCDPMRFTGSIGVFGGASLNTYLLYQVLPNRAALAAAGVMAAAIASDKDALTQRVAYALNLKGPAVTVQTACSTSLVAVQLACQSLQNFQCDLALAGGVSIKVPHAAGYVYQEGGVASADGHCRPFDAAAGGTVPASGCAIVALRRLEDAVREGDEIVAVIRGAAVNNDGAEKTGFTAPGVAGQAEVIALAQAQAGVEPDSIGFVETHGTATPLGDPIEVAALAQAFAGIGAGKRCVLGAVKSNIGHLDAAAGAAGLIKAALAVKHGLIPPTLHFSQPNPAARLEQTPFVVSAAAERWLIAGPRRAGVSSFGIGGTNAHVVIEERGAGAVAEKGEGRREKEWLVVSARTVPALAQACERLAAFLERRPELRLMDVAHTLRIGRRAFARRTVVVAATIAEAVAALRSEGRRIADFGLRIADRWRGEMGGGGMDAEGDAGGHTPAFGHPSQEGSGWPQVVRRWVEGATVDWRELGSGGRKVGLPTYPFQRVRYWIEGEGKPETGERKTENGERRPETRAGEHTPAFGHPSQEGSGGIADRGLRISDRPAVTVGVARLGTRDVGGWTYRAAWRRVERSVGGGTRPGGRTVDIDGLNEAEAFALVREAAFDGRATEILVVGRELVSVGPADRVRPAGAAVIAAAQVLMQELPGRRIRIVDSGAATGSERAARLAAEWAAPADETVVAWREGARWVRGWAGVPVGVTSAPVWREGGVYLITGGLGKVGLALATELARVARARLVLVGRRGAVGVDARVREVEAAGGEFLVVSADVADEAAIRRAVTEGEARFGALHGVIHAAGLAGEAALRSAAETDEAFRAAQWRPKVDGWRVLDTMLAGKPLDFRVAMSSLSTVLGGLGLSAYAAANAGLEACVEESVARGRDPWTAVAWDGWDFRGDGERTGIGGAEGVELLARIVARGEPGVWAVATSELNARLRRWVFGKPETGNRKPETGGWKREREDGRSEMEDPAARAASQGSAGMRSRAEVERGLVELWREAVGSEPAGFEQNFFEAGGDSLAAVQIVSRINERFAQSLSVASFMDRPTIAAVAERIAGANVATGGVGDPAAHAASHGGASHDGAGQRVRRGALRRERRAGG